MAQAGRLIGHGGVDDDAVEIGAKQRLPEVALETVLQQVGGASPPRGHGPLAEHDGDELTTVAGCAGDDVELDVVDAAAVAAAAAAAAFRALAGGARFG